LKKVFGLHAVATGVLAAVRGASLDGVLVVRVHSASGADPGRPRMETDPRPARFAAK
jgi:hypothetical protein